MRASMLLLPTKRGVRRWHLIALANPLHDPSLLIASLLTFIELGGLPVYWYWIPGITLVNLLLVRIITWLMTMSLLYCLLFLYKAGKRGIFRRPTNQDSGTSGKGRYIGPDGWPEECVNVHNDVTDGRRRNVSK